MNTRQQLVTLGFAAFLAGWFLALAIGEPGPPVGRLLLVAGIGVAMVSTGVLAGHHGEHRAGLLVGLAGMAWLVGRLLRFVQDPLVLALAGLVAAIGAALVLHAVLAYSAGRPRSPRDPATTIPLYAVAAGPLLLLGDDGFAHRSGAVVDSIAAAVLVAFVVLVVRRAATASPAARRASGLVRLAGMVLAVSLVVVVAADFGDIPLAEVHGPWLDVAVGAVPIAMAVSLVVRRLTARRLLALVADLDSAGPGLTLRNALRRTLCDPSLEIVYLRGGSGGWVSDLGLPANPTSTASRASTPIVRDGKPIAALVHDPVLLDSPDRVRAAIGAAALALDNEQLKAELRAELHDVRASRTRIVEAADRERRRVERNLHDGAQQRLVGLALTLRMAGRRAVADPALADLLDEAASELDAALRELRELARGIHPAIVTDAGLTGALETLAERPGAPVELVVDLPAPLPDHVAVGAYYVAAEAVANANKHSGAARVTVHVSVTADALHLTVADDGRGGASATAGSGLEGLLDRVSSLAGHLTVLSPPGQGTVVTAVIPLRAPPSPSRDGRSMAALRWIGWESWEVPAEAYDQLMDEDNLNHAKAVIACAGGNGQVTMREREWLLGYHAAAGTAAWVLESIATYDGTEPLEEIMALPSMTATRRGVLHDAIRMSAADGDLDAAELDHLRRGSDAMGIPGDVFVELQRIVAEEGALRGRRHQLVVAPVLPGTLSSPAAAVDR